MDTYFSFQWHITDDCDQRCTHCYIFSEDNHIPIRTMQWADMEKTLENCLVMCSEFNRAPYFYITGGDPILHKDFWRLLAALKEKGISFTLMGNPFHLNDDVCRKLRSFGCERYQLSIDGLEQTHDAIRKPGSFATTLEKISCIRDAGIKSVIMSTVSGGNIVEIPGIIDLVVEHRADVFAFARYCPANAGKSTHVTPEDYRALLEICWRKFGEYKDASTVFTLKDHLWTLFLHEKGLYQIPEGLDADSIYDGCNCGISHLTILPNGDVYACRRMESVVGNVFRDQLTDIFLGGRMDAYRDYTKFEKCAKCELMRFCRGCPAVASGYTGSHYSADPQCWKTVAA
jgi:radical SAM/SPASM domain protein of ACGX system